MERDHRILIVDDAAMFRELESLFLARSGRVSTAANASEALEAIQRDRPHVLVTDLCMPGMPGDVLCKVIKSDPRLRDMHVIIVTSSEDPDEHARAIRSGADDVLTKPLNRISLSGAVNRLLRSNVPRGLKRVSLDAPVRLEISGAEAWARARNVSRGGIYVESECPLPPPGEIALEFALPEGSGLVCSTARVVWQHDAPPHGMGLQFLALDRTASQQIEDFVYERAPLVQAPPPRRAAGVVP